MHVREIEALKATCASVVKRIIYSVKARRYVVMFHSTSACMNKATVVE